MKTMVVVAVGIIILAFAFDRSDKNATIAKAIAAQLKPQCEEIAAQQGKTCRGVMVVIK